MGQWGLGELQKQKPGHQTSSGAAFRSLQASKALTSGFLQQADHAQKKSVTSGLSQSARRTIRDKKRLSKDLTALEGVARMHHCSLNPHVQGWLRRVMWEL